MRVYSEDALHAVWDAACRYTEDTKFGNGSYHEPSFTEWKMEYDAVHDKLMLAEEFIHHNMFKKNVVSLPAIVSIASISTMVSAYDVSELPTKTHEVSMARSLSYMIAFVYSDASLSEIGRHIGGRDHSTVSAMAVLFSERIATDERARNSTMVAFLMMRKYLFGGNAMIPSIFTPRKASITLRYTNVKRICQTLYSMGILNDADMKWSTTEHDKKY